MNGIKNLKKIGLDSNVFIYNLEQNPHYIDFTDIIFTRLISNRLKAVTNVITLAEILSYPKTEKAEKTIIEDFVNTPNLEIIDVNHGVAVKAARIRRKYGFHLADSVQLATALASRAQAFITNDQRLKKFGQLPVISLSSLKF